MKRGRLVRVLGAALLLLGSASEVRGQTDRLEVRALDFEGNRVAATDSLRRAIVNRQTECRAWVVAPFCWLGIERALDRSYLRPSELALDVVRLQYYYWDRGYRDVQVDTTVTREADAARVTFRIREGAPVRVDSMKVVLLEPVADSAVLGNLPLRVGDPLSAIELDAARDSIQGRLRNDGYAYAEVFVSYFIPGGSPDQARVTLDVDPGPRARFGPVAVVDAGVLDEESIRRMLPFEEGALYRRDRLLQGQRSLFGLDIIQGASIEELRDDVARDSIIPVTVRVAEGNLHRVRAGFGWTTAECLSTEAAWASRDFYGGARRLEVRARLAHLLAPQVGSSGCPQAGSGAFAKLTGQVAVELFQPWIFSPRNSLSVSAFIERQSLPEVFIREALGFNFSLNRSIGRRASLTLSYQPQLAQLEAAEIFFCASFLACLPSDIRVFQGANWLAPVGLSAVRDRRNSVLNPDDGSLLRLGLEHAAGYTGSNFEYSRALGEASLYGFVGPWVGAARLRAGLVGRGRLLGLRGGESPGLVHPQKRFYAGGANSVRGFAENRLGPSVLAAEVADVLSVPMTEGASEPACVPEQVADLSCDPSAVPDADLSPRAIGGNAVLEGNLELRFPTASPNFQGVAFLDFGQVWVERRDVRLNDLEFSPGVGMRYFSPIGPIRVDVGYRFREGERLRVATSGIRAFDALRGDVEGDRIRIRTADGGSEAIDWVRTDELVFLRRQLAYGADRSFLSRLQLHISIGQAF